MTDLSGGAHFNNISEVHYRDLVRDVLYNRKVVGNKDVGHSLLALELFKKVDDLCLDGHVKCGYRLVTGGRKHPNQEFIQINTENILFICGGAFDTLDQLIEERNGNRKIGYDGNVLTTKEKEEKNILIELLINEQIKHMIPNNKYETEEYNKLEELKTKFPEAKIIRMDADTTEGRTSHEKLLEQFGLCASNIVATAKEFCK